MSTVKQDAELILTALNALATAEAVSAFGAKLDAISTKLDALAAAHGDTSTSVTNSAPVIASIADAVGATIPAVQ